MADPKNGMHGTTLLMLQKNNAPSPKGGDSK